MQKFIDVLSRWDSRSLSALEAAEMLGCSERQFRRYRARCEEEGLAGLLDKRLGKASARGAPADEVAWMLDQYRSDYRGAGGAAGWAHRRKRPRKPCEGMMLHQGGSRFAWLEGQPASPYTDGGSFTPKAGQSGEQLQCC